MTRILLDEPATVGALTIRGTLTTAPIPLTLNATSITITGGAWRAGTATTPHPAPLTVTLRGANRVVTVDTGGVLALYGPVPSPVMTTLLAGADAGASTVQLATSTNWSTGDDILITHSGYHSVAPAFTFPAGTRGNTERFVVTNAAATSLGLSAPLATSRLGILDAGVPLDVRAEVANLSRRIVLAGANDADWTDGGVGVSVVTQNTPGEVTLSGVRLERAGRQGTVMPGTEVAALRLHRMSTAAPARVAGSVITDSASRGVELDLTSNATLSDNVITRTRGHGVWMLTGAERDNVIERNLVAQLSPPAFVTLTTATEARTLTFTPTDPGFCGSSGFVLANPDNVVRGNVAADLPGCGFWLSFSSEPRGLGAGVDLAPNHVGFGTFDDNTTRASAGPGVLLGSGIRAMGSTLVAEPSVYTPQLDERRFTAEDLNSTLRATLRRTRVFTALDDGFRVDAKRVTLEQPTLWSHGGFGVLPLRDAMELTDVLFIGRLGPIIQPSTLPTLSWVATPPMLTVTRGRIAHYRASPTTRAGGVLLTFGNGLFGFERTLGQFTQVSISDADLGVRAVRPGADYEMTGPILDGPGVGGSPGRWWVDSIPYFTQGYSCQPAPRGSTTSGELCAAPGYFSLFGVWVGTGTAMTINDRVSAELVREVAGAPSLDHRIGAGANNRDQALAVPLNETVRLRFPAYTLTPRLVRFITWGRAGERAILRIPYPAGTTFTAELRNELGFAFPAPVTLTAAASLLEVTSDPAGTKYFFDGAFLHLSLRADWPGTTPWFRHALTIRATGPGLP